MLEDGDVLGWIKADLDRDIEAENKAHEQTHSTSPSPPSLKGSWITLASGSAERIPSIAASHASFAEIQPLNESNATIIFFIISVKDVSMSNHDHHGISSGESFHRRYRCFRL